MRRFAGAALVSGFALAPLAFLTVGAATPSPTPKPSKSATFSPAPPPAKPQGPPAPVAGMPRPSPNCLTQHGRARLTAEPWAQRALGFSSVWDLTRGQHVTVAVVDSGIDFTPQLAGRVTHTDLTGGDGADCIPHGTLVASIIAAADARAKGIPFYGVAPAARILSVRVQQQEGTGGLSDAQRRKALLNIANGIRYAVARHARVINVSIQVSASYPALQSAVEFAQRHNVVVVAAAGNDNPGGGQGPFYPASYPGVLSVNAVDQSGQLGGFDVSRTPVSVTAPGVDIASDYPGGFDPSDNGTSFAAAFVSGEAALVRAAYPRMPAAQVVHRIIATASGRTGAHTGAGMINPVQAVTAVLPAQPPVPRPAGSVRIPRPRAVNPFTRTVALSVTGGAITATALVAIAALVIPAGRRRRWHPGPFPATSAARPRQGPRKRLRKEAAVGHFGAARTPRRNNPLPPTPPPVQTTKPAISAEPAISEQPATVPPPPPPALLPDPPRDSPTPLPDVLPPLSYGQLASPPPPTPDPPQLTASPPAPDPPPAPTLPSPRARHRRRK